MAIRKVVTNTDIGDGLKIDESKLNVEVDGTTIIIEDGALTAVAPDINGLQNVRLEGSDLIFTLDDDSEVTVGLSSLVPAVKADRFLSDVSYDEDSNTFIFTTSEDGDNEETISVPISDIVDNFKLQVSGEADNSIELRNGKIYVPPIPKEGDTIQDLGGNTLGKLLVRE